MNTRPLSRERTTRKQDRREFTALCLHPFGGLRSAPHRRPEERRWGTRPATWFAGSSGSDPTRLRAGPARGHLRRGPSPCTRRCCGCCGIGRCPPWRLCARWTSPSPQRGRSQSNVYTCLRGPSSRCRSSLAFAPIDPPTLAPSLPMLAGPAVDDLRRPLPLLGLSKDPPLRRLDRGGVHSRRTSPVARPGSPSARECQLPYSFRPRGFSPHRRLSPPLRRGHLAARFRPWGSARFR